MYLSQVFYIFNSGKYLAKNKCENGCEGTAVSLTADCHGDSLSLCKACWEKWFKEQLLHEFDKKIEDEYIETNYKGHTAYLNKK